MSNLWPQGTIYSFEPVPDIYLNLQKNTNSYSNIHTFSCALGDKDDQALFYVSATTNNPNQSYASSSLLEPKEHLNYAQYVIFNKQIQVPIAKLSSICKKNNIRNIDMLYLDMQGYELNMLKASKELLKNIKIIYTEVEFVEAYKGQYLYKDVKHFLKNLDFKIIAKDFKKMIKVIGMET